MSPEKFNFPKLKGEENYPTWCIRGEAPLITQGYIDDLEDIVKEVKMKALQFLVPLMALLHLSFKASHRLVIRRRKTKGAYLA